MVTDNTTQETSTETVQILSLNPGVQRIFDMERALVWEDVIEQGAVFSQDGQTAWYLVVDIPNPIWYGGDIVTGIYHQNQAYGRRQYDIWEAPRDHSGYIGIWELHELLECKFCGNLGRQENSDYCGSECHQRDKQGERL